MPFLRFLGWNVLGAMVWCSIVVTIGYLVGDQLYRVAEVAHSVQRWIALAALLICLAFWFFWWRDRNQPAATRPGP